MSGESTCQRAITKRIGNVLLAHSDGQGMPAVESAIVEAQNAVEIIRRGRAPYSTVTLFARLRGWSTSLPMKVAT